MTKMFGQCMAAIHKNLKQTAALQRRTKAQIDKLESLARRINNKGA